MSRRAYSFVVAATAVCLLPAAAHAACVAPGFNTSGKFCNGCRYEGSMTMSRDEVCERPYRGQAATGPIMEVIGHRLVQRAKHGIAGISGTTMAYSPSKGYAGTDEFVVEVDYRQGTDKGKFYVHWSVTVQ